MLPPYFLSASCTTSHSPEGYTTVFTKLAVTQDLFDLQTSAGAYCKDNELQNRRASSEFRQMALQVRLDSVSASFGTTLVFSLPSTYGLQHFWNRLQLILSKNHQLKVYGWLNSPGNHPSFEKKIYGILGLKIF